MPDAPFWSAPVTDVVRIERFKHTEAHVEAPFTLELKNRENIAKIRKKSRKSVGACTPVFGNDSKKERVFSER